MTGVYPLYVQKAERKGRSKAEVDQIICWLTGYDQTSLEHQLTAKVNVETFFREAPAFQAKASKITGTVCGIRVEDITDPTVQKIRYLDKLIDELAKGRSLEKILRK